MLLFKVYPALQLHVAVNVLFSVYVHLNAVPAAFVSLVPLTAQPANVAFAFVIVLLLGVAGVKLLLYVALPALILPDPPVPAAYVTVYVFAVQFIVVLLAVGLLYPAEQVPLYVHLLPLVLTLHVAAPVPFTHALHVSNKHVPVLIVLFVAHTGCFHVAKFVMLVHAVEHD